MLVLRKILSKDKSLVYDSFWAIIGSAIGKGLSLLAGILIARFLGKDAFGEYGMIKSNLLLISTFSTFGLAYSATKFIAQYKNNNAEMLFLVYKESSIITTMFSVALAILTFVLSGYIAIILEGEHLSSILRLSSVAIVFNAVSITQIGVLAGLGLYKRIAYINTYVGIITCVFSILLTFFWGIEGAAVALVLSYFSNCILNLIEINKHLST